MNRLLSALLVVLLAVSPALATGTPVTIFDVAGNPVGTAAGALATTSAPYSTTTPFTVGGAAVAPGRATAANCTAAGSVTYTLSGGGSYAVPVVVGWNSYPFAVTGASASTATCTYANLS